MKQVTCRSCGWVHMGVRRKTAEKQIARFNKFYDAASEIVREHFAGRLHLSDFKQCFRCRGSFLNFRATLSTDCPDCSTIQLILLPPELE